MAKPFLLRREAGPALPGRRGQPELVVFEDLTFGVEQGELVTIIGHSGCGKSTILNAVAGLAQASDGYVFVNGRAGRPGPSISRGVIFQNHSLLPWKTALGNVDLLGAGALARVVARAGARAQPALPAPGGLRNGAENRRPAQLSGGMRQRVGIARAFAIQPEVLLMDEPFGALDALTRATVQDELLALWRDSGLTVFMITHDIDEAIYLSDRVLLMSEGPHARLAAGRAHPAAAPARPRLAAARTRATTRCARAWSTSCTDAHEPPTAEGEHHGQDER